MGGANAIFNVFDPATYAAQQIKIQKFEEANRQASSELRFEEISEHALDQTDPNRNPQQSKA